MMMTMRFWTVAALALAALLSAGEAAQAQATRTWVSGVGDDANPCSRTAPCKTFAGAISKTAAGGEINVIDPGGFGAVTITKSISIIAEGSTGGVLAAGSAGVIVNSATPIRVHLEGLDFEGVGNGTGLAGTTGVRVLGTGAKVVVKRCSIRNFNTAGVETNGGLGTRVYIEDSVLEGNQIGVKLIGTGAANTGYLTNSTIFGSKDVSVQVTSPSSIFLNRSTLAESVNGDLQVIGATGRTISYGNNVIRNGTPTDQFPLE
jgi:hypothetical protein